MHMTLAPRHLRNASGAFFDEVKAIKSHGPPDSCILHGWKSKSIGTRAALWLAVISHKANAQIMMPPSFYIVRRRLRRSTSFYVVLRRSTLVLGTFGPGTPRQGLELKPVAHLE